MGGGGQDRGARERRDLWHKQIREHGEFMYFFSRIFMTNLYGND